MTTDAPVVEGTILWTPSEARTQGRMAEFMDWLAEEGGLAFSSYAELWAWSVSDVGDFWRAIWDYFEVIAHTAPTQSLAEERMPGAVWFPGATLNYAEHALRWRGDEPALIARDERGARVELSRNELRQRVARAQAGLRRLGVGEGDRVAAFAPNVPETVITFLAAASLGAVWSSCSPEFGVASVLDRFQQIEPKVLLGVEAYRYGGKVFERGAALDEILAGLPSLEAVVMLPCGAASSERVAPVPSGAGQARQVRALSFDELLSEPAELTFQPVPFDHPLWILYSSGTTGLPKAIVQGHGGILLEHHKALGLHCELGPGSRCFWFSTTGWMMWNFLLGGLLVGATPVLYDGSPGYPDLGALWRLAAEERLAYFGTSAPYLLSCEKAGIRPAEQDLAALRTLGSTGAPLPSRGFEWVYREVKSDLLLASVSGGTDVCTAFAPSCALLPVRAGALQCAGLGCKLEAFDPEGRPLIDEVGELVLTRPLPSMPLYFWGDQDGRRYHDSYFDMYPGVWRHGDWVKISSEGWLVISGRSDSTLNRGGVRMGTSEFYAVVERVPGIVDSLVVDTSDAPGGKLWLFVVLGADAQLDAALERTLATQLRRELSPRHIPDQIVAVPAIPRTLSGKKCEVPVKRILGGAPAEQAVSRDTLQEPSAVDVFVRLAERVKPAR